MDESVSNLQELLSTMEPTLHKGIYVYSSIPFDTDMSKIKPIVTLCEPEGLTVITDEQNARDANLTIMLRVAWITLTVHSDLKVVGFTAVFSKALGNANISCNVVAGAFHDHIFVPIEASDNAMKVLLELQRESQKNLNR